MNNTEEALKERIKELTCLYEVSSIIVNADLDQMQETLQAIGISLKRAFQFPERTAVRIETPLGNLKMGETEHEKEIMSSIKVFNKDEGKVTAFLNDTTIEFLEEEEQLLDNVSLKVGNLLERIEIRQNEASLKRQMERADRLSIIGEITAGIAHELNTPLANILGFAELLKDEFKKEKNVSDDLDKIIHNAIFSREVVKKLMFFACEMPQEMKKVNIVPNIKDAISLLDATFRKEEVKYVVKIQEEEMWLKADKLQLTQIMFNLIINAIYFSPKNGLVTIEAFQTEKENILKISDEGPGLPTNEFEKIFQPFYSTKPTGDGSGLGLSVVHGIVLSHKGTIKAENNKNKGATFTVRLPKN